MKIIYSLKYEECYPTNPIENPDRVRLLALELKEAGYEFVEPTEASDRDVARVHGRKHIEIVKRRGLYDVASLQLEEQLMLQSLVCRESHHLL